MTQNRKRLETKTSSDTVGTGELAPELQNMQNKLNVLQQQVLRAVQMISETDNTCQSLASARTVLDVVKPDKFYERNARSC